MTITRTIAATLLLAGSIGSVAAFEPIATVAGQHPVIHVNGGTATDEIIATAEQTGGQFSLVTLAGPAGDGPGPAIIHHTGTDVFYVLEGEAQLFAGDKMVEGGPGTTIIADAGTPHGYIAKTPLKMLVIFLPGGYEHFFMEWAETKDLVPGPALGALENKYGVTRP